MKKLRNRNTGVIGVLVAYDVDKGIFAVKSQGGDRCYYYSLAALHDVWEDYEEPKVGYIIDPMEEDCVSVDDSGYEELDIERAKELGIWLKTREEAEKAVEKLKAFKRLKDKSEFEIISYEFDAEHSEGHIDFFIPRRNTFDTLDLHCVKQDLDLLFSGGEE